MTRLRLALTNRGAESGYTMVELIAVMAILITILTGLTTLFVSGARAELDLNTRFEAQQNARVALDRMRREVHCASGVTPTTGLPVASVAVTLPGHCPGAGGAEVTVTYSTASVSTGRWRLTRQVGAATAIPIADYLTAAALFTYLPAQGDSVEGANDGKLGRLHVDLPVNVHPDKGWREWRLVDDIVLRNTLRVTTP